MKISLQRFLTLGLMAIFLCGSLTAATLWYSTRHTSVAIEHLAESVESAASAHQIQQNLSIHRRQALLIGLKSQSERRKLTKLLSARLLKDADDLSKYSSSPAEAIIIQKVKQSIISYLDNYDSFRTEGVRAADLYELVTEEYEKCREAIVELMEFNLDEAKVVQKETSNQSQLDYVLVSSMLVLLALAFFILLIGLRKLLYTPVLRLNGMIQDFELGAKPEIGKIKGASEIQAIASSFELLSEKLSRQKDAELTFLSAIAHDLKNPLGAIKMSAELMTDDGGLSQQSKEMLSIIGRQADHLMRLISDLLDTTRIESGHMELRFGIHDIRKLIRDSALLHSSLSNKHQLEIQLPDVPIYVSCDEQRLTQVFNNLFNNAIKYSPNGGKIKVTGLLEGKHVIVKICDTGIGILPEDLQGVFEPFRRSSTSRMSIPGIGLGLSSSRKILRAHEDGDISVISKPGVGTTFTLKLRRLDNANLTKTSLSQET